MVPGYEGGTKSPALNILTLRNTRRHNQPEPTTTRGVTFSEVTIEILKFG